MNNLNGRVAKLEKQAGGEKRHMVMYQDDNDPELFRGHDREYRRGDDWPEKEGVTLFLITYNREWPPAEAA